ncbi:MAG: hypothetical protein KAW01_00415 [Deltaproteobacteria bacterium]|nr:hypothetical protein [Deltaproteobacteria bacterium]
MIDASKSLLQSVLDGLDIQNGSDRLKVETLMRRAEEAYPYAFQECFAGDYSIDDDFFADGSVNLGQQKAREAKDRKLFCQLIEGYLERKPKEIKDCLGLEEEDADSEVKIKKQAEFLFDFYDLLFTFFYSRHEYNGAIDATDFVDFVTNDRWRKTAEFLYAEYDRLRKVWKPVKSFIFSGFSESQVSLPVKFSMRMRLNISIEGNPGKIILGNSAFNTVDAFINFISGLPVDIFSRCAYYKCQKCIVKVTKRKIYCTHNYCGVLAAQARERQEDIEGFRQKDRERKRKKKDNSQKKPL